VSFFLHRIYSDSHGWWCKRTELAELQGFLHDQNAGRVTRPRDAVETMMLRTSLLGRTLGGRAFGSILQSTQMSTGLKALERRVKKAQRASEIRFAELQNTLKNELADARRASEERLVEAQKPTAELADARKASENRLADAQTTVKDELADEAKASEIRWKVFTDANAWKVTRMLISGMVFIVGYAVAVLHWLGFDVLPRRRKVGHGEGEGGVSHPVVS